METEGLVLDLETIERMRDEIHYGSYDLQEYIERVDASIDNVIKAFPCDQNHKFYDTFKKDKESLEPLFSDIHKFEEILWKLEDFLRPRTF